MMRIILGLALALCSLSCAKQEAEEIVCVRGDMTAAMPPQHKELFERLEPWVTDAVSCTVNGISYVAAADPSFNSYFVHRGDEFIVGQFGNTMLFMDGQYLHIYASDTDSDGHLDDIEYMSWKGPRGYVSAHDWNLDGQPDIRTSESDNGEPRYEASINGIWTEFIIDGAFRLATDPSKRLTKGETGNWIIVESQD